MFYTTYSTKRSLILSGADLGGGGGGGGLGGCNPHKARETHHAQCTEVQNYSTVCAQTTVQPERKKKVGIYHTVVRCSRASQGATPSQSAQASRN